MAALRGDEIVGVDISEAISKQKLVKPDNQAVLTARAIGISFGDEK
ncbi:MAG: hypothetical protein M5T52_07890 [Ignavibacteriaceae bacterium]|nr:hypothetical protein [Ignavibacteriaceae bacterium]